MAHTKKAVSIFSAAAISAFAGSIVETAVETAVKTVLQVMFSSDAADESHAETDETPTPIAPAGRTGVEHDRAGVHSGPGYYPGVFGPYWAGPAYFAPTARRPAAAVPGRNGFSPRPSNPHLLHTARTSYREWSTP